MNVVMAFSKCSHCGTVGIGTAVQAESRVEEFFCSACARQDFDALADEQKSAWLAGGSEPEVVRIAC